MTKRNGKFFGEKKHIEKKKKTQDELRKKQRGMIK